LEELNLASNTISVIPSFIERIHKLRAIRFDDNQITSLPHEMAHLSLLEVLIMPGNGMSVVPKWIGHFQELRYLDLSRCPIVEIAAEIGNCKNLEVLDLSGGGKLVKLPKEICCLNNLRSLRLADNKIDKLPSNIGILSKLRELSVPNNRLVELPVSLGLCMELGTPSGKLELAGNPIIQKDLRNACERLGQIELFQFLHARTLSVKVKFDQYSPPKMGSLPKPAEKLSAKTVDKFSA
jgi:Leucine-rich repeat (LRR) protein